MATTLADDFTGTPGADVSASGPDVGGPYNSGESYPGGIAPWLFDATGTQAQGFQTFNSLQWLHPTVQETAWTTTIRFTLGTVTNTQLSYRYLTVSNNSHGSATPDVRITFLAFSGRTYLDVYDGPGETQVALVDVGALTDEIHATISYDSGTLRVYTGSTAHLGAGGYPATDLGSKHFLVATQTAAANGPRVNGLYMTDTVDAPGDFTPPTPPPAPSTFRRTGLTLGFGLR
jgi:hypothetical protein